MMIMNIHIYYQMTRLKNKTYGFNIYYDIDVIFQIILKKCI